MLLGGSALGGSAKAALRNYNFASAAERTLQYENFGYFNFSLRGRRGQNRGWFDNVGPRGRTAPIGDILFLPAGFTLRSACAPGRHETMTCLIDAAVFPIDASRLNENALACSLDLRSHAILRGLLRILQETMRPSLASPLAIEAPATLLAVDAARVLSCAAEKSKRGGLSPQQMRRLENRIRSDSPIPSIAQLAKDCGISDRHLARCFLQETGQTLGNYVRAASMERAMEALANGDIPIKQIAADLGFAGGASFACAFRRATGLSPRDFRQSI